MIWISIKIIKEQFVFGICHAVVPAVLERVDLEEHRFVLKPEVLETSIADRTQQTLIKIIRLVLAGIDVLVRPDDRQDLAVRTPGIIFVKFFIQLMIGIENLKSGIFHVLFGTGYLILDPVEKRSVKGIIFLAIIVDNARRYLDTVHPDILKLDYSFVNMEGIYVIDNIAYAQLARTIQFFEFGHIVHDLFEFPVWYVTVISVTAVIPTIHGDPDPGSVHGKHVGDFSL